MIRACAVITLTTAIAAVAALAAPPASAPAGYVSPPARVVTVTVQTGVASTFQMALGGMFGDGPALSEKLTFSVNNVWRPGDSLSLFGWSTTDTVSKQSDWQTGVGYKSRLLHRKHHTLSLGGGVQRWLLPSVKTGANDWLLSGTLTYGTSLKGVPILLSHDSWSLLRSSLRKGSAIYTQLYTQHPVMKRERFQLALRHGPQHTYSQGFYGAEGHRVLRYGASVVLTSKHAVLEGTYRQQFGLQNSIPNNQYWAFSITHHFARRVSSR